MPERRATMTLDLLPADESAGHLIPGGDPSALALAGQVANQYAARDVFSDYRARKGGKHAAAAGWRAGPVCGLPVGGRHPEPASSG